MPADLTTDSIYRPVLIKKEPFSEKQNVIFFKSQYPHAIVSDLFASQVKELIKVRNPRSRWSPQQLDEQYSDWLGNRDPDLEGTWVYYPWSNRLLHILDEPDFIQLRTARNQHKITAAEQLSLSKRTIGIIGLSVGHAVALTMATERSFGQLRLADFDTLELSNLNRIRVGLHQIGLNKSIITAREIAEIDPFLKVECFTEGITNENLEQFLTENGRVDLLIDECDDFEIKLKCRYAAKSLGIPVVMETSDRGMVDVERFDLEKDRPILHGILSDIPPEKLRDIPPQERVGLVMRVINVAESSLRARASLMEVGQTIGTWPQLASAVTLGGGVVADVSRRLLLGTFRDSGRYHVDLEQLIKDKPADIAATAHHKLPFDLAAAIHLADSLPLPETQLYPDRETIKAIVASGSSAFSWGNAQPWKWLYRNGRLYLFKDYGNEYAFSDPHHIAAQLALGAACRNVALKCTEAGYQAKFDFFPAGKDIDLIAAITFYDQENEAGENEIQLARCIDARATSRSAGLEYQLTEAELDFLQSSQSKSNDIHLKFVKKQVDIAKIGTIAADCDLLFLLNEAGHQEFFETHTKPTAGPARGFTLQQYTQDPALLLPLSLLREKKVAQVLHEVDGGALLAGQIGRTIAASSCIAAIAVNNQPEQIIQAGMLMQDIWLRAEKLGLAAQPLLSPGLFFNRLNNGDGLTEKEIAKLTILKAGFQEAVSNFAGLETVFLLRIHKISAKTIKTDRLPLDEIMFIVNNEF